MEAPFDYLLLMDADLNGRLFSGEPRESLIPVEKSGSVQLHRDKDTVIHSSALHRAVSLPDTAPLPAGHDEVKPLLVISLKNLHPPA